MKTMKIEDRPLKEYIQHPDTVVREFANRLHKAVELYEKHEREREADMQKLLRKEHR